MILNAEAQRRRVRRDFLCSLLDLIHQSYTVDLLQKGPTLLFKLLVHILIPPSNFLPASLAQQPRTVLLYHYYCIRGG